MNLKRKLKFSIFLLDENKEIIDFYGEQIINLKFDKEINKYVNSKQISFPAATNTFQIVSILLLIDEIPVLLSNLTSRLYCFSGDAVSFPKRALQIQLDNLSNYIWKNAQNEFEYVNELQPIVNKYRLRQIMK